MMDDLNVDSFHKVGEHEHIQSAHLAIFRLFRKFGSYILHINNSVVAGLVQKPVQKSNRDALSAWVAEQQLKHKFHFQVEVFFWQGEPSFREILRGDRWIRFY
jgi:hypothetical protein